jgi:hypothetical protein
MVRLGTAGPTRLDVLELVGVVVGTTAKPSWGQVKAKYVTRGRLPQ